MRIDDNSAGFKWKRPLNKHTHLKNIYRLDETYFQPMSFYSNPFQFAISDNKSFSPTWVNNESLVTVNNLFHNP